MVICFARYSCASSALTFRDLLRKIARASSFSSVTMTTDASPACAEDGTVVLGPPPVVRGMTELERDAFRTSAAVPYVDVPTSTVGAAVRSIKDCLLKVRDVKPVADAPGGDGDRRRVLLDPQRYSSAADLDERSRITLEASGVDLAVHSGVTQVALSYDSWSAEQVLKAVLPIGLAAPTSFSIVGHIAHLNLKENLLPYKRLVGQVLLDKNKCLKTIVNKMDTIDSTFRNFAMEVLAGEPRTEVTVKENGCVYEFDFAKVYWNPRLGTEHERIVSKLAPRDVVYDVFAGVGPFSVPAARKRCTVLANDLNRDSYERLRKNFELNKVKGAHEAFNMDGRQFVRDVVGPDMARRLAEATSAASAACPESSNNADLQAGAWPQIHIIMNLPALAADFLDAFPSLLSGLCCCQGAAGLRQQPAASAEPCNNAAAAAAPPAASTVDSTLPNVSDSTTKRDLTSDAGDPVASDSYQERSLQCGSHTADSRDHVCSVAFLLNQKAPLVHCYSFGKGENEVQVRAAVARRMNDALGADIVSVDEVRHVRNVAPNKEMFCASFHLPAECLLVRASRLCESDCRIANTPVANETSTEINPTDAGDAGRNVDAAVFVPLEPRLDDSLPTQAPNDVARSEGQVGGNCCDSAERSTSAAATDESDSHRVAGGDQLLRPSAAAATAAGSLLSNPADASSSQCHQSLQDGVTCSEPPAKKHRVKD